MAEKYQSEEKNPRPISEYKDIVEVTDALVTEYIVNDGYIFIHKNGEDYAHYMRFEATDDYATVSHKKLMATVLQTAYLQQSTVNLWIDRRSQNISQVAFPKR